MSLDGIVVFSCIELCGLAKRVAMTTLLFFLVEFSRGLYGYLEL